MYTYLKLVKTRWLIIFFYAHWYYFIVFIMRSLSIKLWCVLFIRGSYTWIPRYSKVQDFQNRWTFNKICNKKLFQNIFVWVRLLNGLCKIIWMKPAANELSFDRKIIRHYTEFFFLAGSRWIIHTLELANYPPQAMFYADVWNIQ